MARVASVLVAVVAMSALSACAPDPPSAVVGVVTTGCGPGLATGSGMLVDPGVILTSAHVVAGASEIRVVRDGASATATVAAFDPEMDLAFLAVDAADLPRGRTPSVDSSRVDAGDAAVAHVIRSGEAVAIPIVVERRVRIDTEDVYVEGHTERPGYVLAGDIRRGDSGGAVVADGRVVGVLWARSRRADGTAYAIDPDRAGQRIVAQHRTGELGPGVDLDRCP